MADSFLLSPADGRRSVFAEGVKARSINGFLQLCPVAEEDGSGRAGPFAVPGRMPHPWTRSGRFDTRKNFCRRK